MDKVEYYTVKEIADSLGVTVQTVYKYLKEIDKKHTKKVKNVMQIDAPGKELIQNLYLKANNGNVTDTNTSKGLVDNLERYISTLEEQIKIKDEQIKNKDEQLTSLADRIKESNLILYQHGIALEGNIEEAETIDTIEAEDIQDISPDAAETELEEAEYKEVSKYSYSLLKRLKFLFTGKLDKWKH